jgi:hypothetical protein
MALPIMEATPTPSKNTKDMKIIKGSSATLLAKAVITTNLTIVNFQKYTAFMGWLQHNQI